MIPTTTDQWIIECGNAKTQQPQPHRSALSNAAFDNLKLQKDVPIPALKPNECLIKVVAVSLNYRDIAIPLGKFPSPARNSYVPTSDGAGIVVAVGDQVKLHRVGDRVCTLFTQDHQKGLFKMAMKKSFLGASIDGPLRQYATYPETGLVQVPKSMTLIEASTLPCAALTAWNSLFGLEGRKVSPGDWVLAQGTGGVSLFAAQLALAAGAKVIHTTSSDKKGGTLKTLGVHHIINYKTDSSWGETAKKLTEGEGCAHVIDVGGEETIAQSFAAVKEEGVISVVGFLGNPEGKHKPRSLREDLRAGGDCEGH